MHLTFHSFWSIFCRPFLEFKGSSMNNMFMPFCFLLYATYTTHIQYASTSQLSQTMKVAAAEILSFSHAYFPHPVSTYQPAHPNNGDYLSLSSTRSQTHFPHMSSSYQPAQPNDDDFLSLLLTLSHIHFPHRLRIYQPAQSDNDDCLSLLSNISHKC